MPKTTKKTTKKAAKAAKTRKKSAAKNPTKKRGVGTNPTLIPGNPGNSGGKPGRSGRPPSKIREAARLAFAERLKVLTNIADDEDGRPTDRIQALKVLADTGGVDKIALALDEQPETEGITPETVARMWEQIKRVKTVEQLEKMLVAAAKKQQKTAE